MKLWNKVGLLLLVMACKKDLPIENTSYNPIPYQLLLPIGRTWTQFPIPNENPLTVEGVSLGKLLFEEKMLSANNAISCKSCHQPEYAFSDGGKQFSEGINQLKGNRNAPALFNLGWTELYNITGHRFFWDGGKGSLEQQVIGPIVNPVEMASNTKEVVKKLQNTSIYPRLFKKAFGTDSITIGLVAKAISQYERTLISGNSPYDKAERRERLRTPSEQNGMISFSTEKWDCFHCHGNLSSAFFTDFNFHNNGLDEVSLDSGLFRVTGLPADRGKFKTPSLRNLVFTAPYMHDGRFKTLWEVIEFYNSGFKNSPTLDPFISKHIPNGGLNLTPIEKTDLYNFLVSLSDTDFVLKHK